jgi:LysM repeat protein
MKLEPTTIPFLFFLFLFSIGCMQTGDVIDEKDHPAFERGKSLLKVGKSQEALDEFLAVTRRLTECPQSHLECGRLLLSLEARKDPVAAIYHFRRYLLLEPNSRESSKVEQLIITAEREILRKLPGEPYGDYLDSLKLKEENDRLTREIADLRARLGLPVSKSSLAAVKPAATTNKPVPVLATPGNIPPIQPARPAGPTQMQTYVVQSGDSLYAISRKFYGDSSRIDLIFEANRDVMRSKNSLSVGQKLRIPPVPLNR